MTQQYFSKSVVIGNTGVTASCWIISSLAATVVPIPSLTVWVAGWIDLASFQANKAPIPRAVQRYDLNATDLAAYLANGTLPLAQLYTLVAGKQAADAKDDLHGCTLASA